MVEPAVIQFIAQQPEPTRQLILHLHQQILEHKGVVAKLRWRIPFYFKNRWLCYLNPQKRGGIDWSFLRGQHFTEHDHLLDARGRSMVKSVYIPDEESLFALDTYGLIAEALAIDEALKK